MRTYPYTIDNGQGELLAFTSVTHGPDGKRAGADGLAQPGAASTKANGGRPALFDAALLMTRYRSEYAMLEIPAPVRRVVVPAVYAVGVIIGKYGKYADAPPPIRG